MVTVAKSFDGPIKCKLSLFSIFPAFLLVYFHSSILKCLTSNCLSIMMYSLYIFMSSSGVSNGFCGAWDLREKFCHAWSWRYCHTRWVALRFIDPVLQNSF